MWIKAGLVALLAAGCFGSGGTEEAIRFRKVPPASVSDTKAWALFDRSVSSGYLPDARAVHVRLDRPAAVWALKVLGPAPYRVSVRTSSGNSIGFPTIDLTSSTAGWHTFSSDALVSTNELVLSFVSTGGEAPIPELELWEVADTATAAGDVSADEVADGLVAFPADSKSDTIAPGNCAPFKVQFERSPALLRRAFLVYETTGVLRSFSLARTINGLARYGGDRWIDGSSTARLTKEQIDPALLALGSNEVKLCAPANATADVSIANLRIVGELDRGTGLGTVATVGPEDRDASALVDGDPSTTIYIGAGERVRIGLDRFVAPDAIVTSAGLITSAACTTRQGTTRALTSRTQSSSAGVVTLVDGSALACAELEVGFAGAVTLGEIDVVGSGIGERADVARLILTSEREHFGTFAWVGGFVTRPATMPGAIRVEMSGQRAEGFSGDFGSVITRTTDGDVAWPVVISSRLPDGTVRSQQLVLGANAQVQLAGAEGKPSSQAVASPKLMSGGVSEEGDVVAARAATASPTSIRLGAQVGVDVPAGALAKSTNITVRHLGQDVLPPLDPGMINVTAPQTHGYEFLPHGMQFLRNVEIVLPYETALLPEGMKPDDIRAFYFDPNAKRWKPLDRVAVDVSEHVTRSATKHFTIMINAVLTVPKNASPLSLDPTALSSIGAASPATNIDLIEPPSANSTGDARVSLPILLPAARGAYAPQLGFGYSSSGGSSWMGVGWDLQMPMSAIEIDSRWGVPRYTHGEEPRYLIDGAELVPTLETDGPTCAGGVPQRRFRARVEGGFAHILRCGDEPWNFRWEVRDRNGTLLDYGTHRAPNEDPSQLDDWGGTEKASLRHPTAPHGILRWNLRRVTDVHGNRTTLSYDSVAPSAESRVMYLRDIKYTSHGSDVDAPYSVEFVRDDGRRPDEVVNARGGFVVKTTELLRKVRVKFGTEVIRDYVLTYKAGDFEKTVLESIRVYGVGGCDAGRNAFAVPSCADELFHKHEFGYYTEPTQLNSALEIPIDDDPDPGQGSLGKGHRTAVRGGISGIIGLSDNSSATVGVSGSFGERNEQIGFYDLNGDGLPDQVFTVGGQIVALYNVAGSNLTSAGPELTGLPGLGREHDDSWGVDASINASEGGYGASGTAGFSNSTSRADRFFTDIDGDMFVDFLVAGGISLSGQPTECGDKECFEFKQRFDYATPGVIDPRQDPLLNRFSDEIGERVILGDPVVRWVAPYSGKIEVTGIARKLLPGGGDGVGIELYRSHDTLVDQLLTAMTIAPSVDTPVTFASATTLDVKTGESLFVRITTGADDGIADDGSLLDEVDARLVVRYTQTCVDGVCDAVTQPNAREPTGEKVFEFDSQAEHRIAGLPAPLLMAAEGTIDVHGILSKQVTPSDVRVCVQVYPAGTRRSYLTGTCTDNDEAYKNYGFQQLFAAERVGATYDVTGIEVKAGDIVVMRVESDFSINPGDVELFLRLDGIPLVAYTQVCVPTGTALACTTDAATLADVPLDGSIFGAFLSLPPHAEMGLHEADRAPPLPFVAPRDGQLRIHPFRDPGASGIGSPYAVRSDRQGLIANGYCVFGCCAGRASGPSGCAGDSSIPAIDVRAGESITIEIVRETAIAAYSTDSEGVTVHYEDNHQPIAAPLVTKQHALPYGIATPFVGGYRGWMYTMWNEPVAFEPSALLEDYRVYIHEDGTALSDARIKEMVRSAQAPQPRFEGRVGALPAAWVGTGSAAFATAATLHAAELGVLSGSADISTGGGLFAGNYARLSGTSSFYIGASLAAGGIEGGATVSSSTTKTTTDVLDLDGDGVLDVIAGEKRTIGTLSALLGVPAFIDLTEGFRIREGHDLSISLGATAVVPLTTSGGRHLAATTSKEPDSDLGFSSTIGFGIGRSQTTADVLDMNGDGLPDKVWRSGTSIKVQYGLGDGFGPIEPFGLVAAALRDPVDEFQATIESPLGLDNSSKALAHDTTITQYETKSANFIVASVSHTTRKTVTRTTRQLADISGDGLPDLLFKRDDEDFIRVQLNLGSVFSSNVVHWTTPNWGVQIAQPLDSRAAVLHLTGADVLAATGSQAGTTIGGSVTIPVIPGFSIGGSGSKSRDTDTYELALADFNGDGSADHVLRRQKSDGTSVVYVKRNQVTGKANLLATVSRPLGGKVSLDYERVGNTVELPQSRYVLKQVEVDDGSDLGEDFASPNLVTTMSYERGFFDRLEKEFFGFAKVTARRADGVSVEAEYHNDTYSRHGLLAKETTRDANGIVLLQHQMEYEVREVLDDSESPVPLHQDCVAHLHPLLARLGAEACVPRFPVMIKDRNIRSEGGTLTKTRIVEDLGHDRFGNVLVSLDHGDDAIASDDVFAQSSYRNDTTRWLLGRATSLDVHASSATGTLLRSRSGEYDSFGDLIAINVNTGTDTATTRLHHDAFGNLDQVTTPTNERDQSQTYDVLEFDAVTHMYPRRMRDGFGLESRADYDLRFGIATSETDTNGAVLSRTLDAFGRLLTVSGPYDGIQAGVAMEYHPNETRPRAVTKTRGAAPPGFSSLEAPTLTTVTIIDGLGQTVELRTSAAKNGDAGMTTSGLVKRDQVGHVVAAYNPFFTASAGTGFITPTLTERTTTQYDALDRQVRVTYADETFERTTFDIANASDGSTLFVARTTAGNGNVREAFHDHLDRARAFVEHPDAATTAETRYDYLPSGELWKIIDAEGNQTQLGYDLRGLRTVLDNPDTGKIEERFDRMGNRVALVEANHRNNTAEVRYEYDRDRLTKIVYPSKPAVTFQYGQAGAPFGRAGRIEKVTDETGSREHFYGALGEVKRTIRVVAPVQPSQPSTTFDLNTVTDSLGRQLQIVYPDGALITNEYDRGGMLRAVKGVGNGWARTYIDDLRYDEFGHRIHARYGNGATTDWTFDPKRERLESVLTNVGAKKLQDLHYKYDGASNPTLIENKLAKLSGGSGTTPGSSSVVLVYDGVDQLKTASGTGAVSAQKNSEYQATFAYTPSHNLFHKQRVHMIQQPGGIPLVPGATNFSSGYIYEPARPHLPVRVGDLAITYDPSGNPTKRRRDGGNVEQRLVWDDDNRMVSFSGGGVQQNNSYDADGNRVRRRGVQSETVFSSAYFDLENGTQGVRHVFASGIRVASELTQFQSGTNPPAPTKQGTAYFFHQDHLQSTTVLTSEDGSVHQSLEFFVDGETWIDRGPQKPANGYLFSGKPFDPDTGFYDFGQRFYDPRTSQWLGVDAAQKENASSAIGRPVVLATSTFAGNSPVGMWDPDGRNPAAAGWGAAIGAGYEAIQQIQNRRFSPVRLGSSAVAGAIAGYTASRVAAAHATGAITTGAAIVGSALTAPLALSIERTIEGKQVTAAELGTSMAMGLAFGIWANKLIGGSSLGDDVAAAADDGLRAYGREVARQTAPNPTLVRDFGGSGSQRIGVISVGTAKGTRVALEVRGAAGISHRQLGNKAFERIQVGERRFGVNVIGRQAAVTPSSTGMLPTAADIPAITDALRAAGFKGTAQIVTGVGKSVEVNL